MSFYFNFRVVGSFCARQIRMTHLQFNLSIIKKFQSLSDPADVSSKTFYDKHIYCCSRRKTLFKFLKIIIVISADTYNVNFTMDVK